MSNPFTILKRTAVKRHRATQRKGRVIDKNFLAWMHARPCLIAGRTGHVCQGRITVHHVREFGSQKDDRKTLTLCEGAHLHAFSKEAIEHGKSAFELKFGISIWFEIGRYNEEYDLEVLSPTPKPNEVAWANEAGLTRRTLINKELYG
jgi:hypothetical protein